MSAATALFCSKAQTILWPSCNTILLTGQLSSHLSTSLSSTTTLSIVGFSPPPGFCSSAKSAPVWRTAPLSWIIAVGVPNKFKLGISLFLPWWWLSQGKSPTEFHEIRFFCPWVLKSWDDFEPLKKLWFWKVLCFCGNSKCHEISHGACAWMSADHRKGWEGGGGMKLLDIVFIRNMMSEPNEQRFVAQYICSLLMDEISEWCKISLSEAIPLKSWECKILKDLRRRRICQIGTIRISGKPLVLNRCQGNFLLINNGSNSRISEQRSEQVWKFWPSPILVWKPQEFAGTSLSESPLSLLCNTSFWFWRI